jgi:hypothetical protein
VIHPERSTMASAEQRYLEDQACACPYCGQGPIVRTRDRHTLMFSRDDATGLPTCGLHCDCRRCGKQWVEIYTLSGVVFNQPFAYLNHSNTEGLTDARRPEA